MIVRRLARWFDDRLRASSFAHHALNKVFPDDWSFMLGEIALYCFVILVLTGTFLTFFFTPSAKEVIYEGGYRPLRGTPMSEALVEMTSKGFGCVGIVDGRGLIAGIVTDGDLRRHMDMGPDLMAATLS